MILYKIKIPKVGDFLSDSVLDENEYFICSSFLLLDSSIGIVTFHLCYPICSHDTNTMIRYYFEVSFTERNHLVSNCSVIEHFCKVGISGSDFIGIEYLCHLSLPIIRLGRGFLFYLFLIANGST